MKYETIQMQTSKKQQEAFIAQPHQLFYSYDYPTKERAQGKQVAI